MEFMVNISRTIANELNIKENQVNVVTNLLDEGSTVPFIARYRKEVTGNLDDTTLRKLETQLKYYRELEERKKVIIEEIKKQEKLTPHILKNINAALTKSRLEDLYLPFKPKRRTKGQIAREAGLEPLADLLLASPELDSQIEAEKFLNKDREINDTSQALEGARFILMERFAEEPELINELKEKIWSEGIIFVNAVAKQTNLKYKDYYDYKESIKSIPSHRLLAIQRGRKEGVLRIKIDLDLPESNSATFHPCEQNLIDHFKIPLSRASKNTHKWLQKVVNWTWRIKLQTHIETHFMSRLKEQSDGVAIDVFSKNLKHLLMGAPAGSIVTMGLDPGLRTGVKVAIINETGKLIDYDTVFPHEPQNNWQQAQGAIAKLILKHNVKLIAIGNGTASRETERFISDLFSQFPNFKKQVQKAVVSEAGASVYSASELASLEFPDLDVTFRGAVSIARRLQDPLAELVKVEPKAIGVGQYQHDVNQTRLSHSLTGTVEDCVNAIGIDLNTASAELLKYIAGLNKRIATNIVIYRDAKGAFRNREQLKEVEQLSDKVFEQCAGFMRVNSGDNPLDASAVHPEAYIIVDKILSKHGKTIHQIMGDQNFLNSIEPNDYITQNHGIESVKDILKELQKPSRDPRPNFIITKFRDDVNKIEDLKENMTLDGVVTNVTNFGAFVDIGVNQDGLVHISQLTSKFVKNPHDIVKTGDTVSVKVLEVDFKRKRITLSMLLGNTKTHSKTHIRQDNILQKKTAHIATKTKQHKPTAKRIHSATLGDFFANAKKIRR